MRISVQWMVAAVLALLVGPAAADVYKCEQPDGSVTFSDQKCGNNAEDVEIRDTRSSSTASTGRSAAERAVHTHCRNKWGDNYRMQKYCRKQQKTAASEMAQQLDHMSRRQRDIFDRCAHKWRLESIEDGFNWRMLQHCYEQQYEALRSLE